MAKKKKVTKKVQEESTEKKIVSRARNLPLHKCYINENWQNEDVLTVFVSRKHKNDNLTIGSFILDKKCAGLFFTNYKFNVDQSELNYYLNQPEYNFEEIDYNIAHNLIWGAVEFAEGYGFFTPKEFDVSEYILEDDDHVDLIEFEYGIKNSAILLRQNCESDIDFRMKADTLKRHNKIGSYVIIGDDGIENPYADDNKSYEGPLIPREFYDLKYDRSQYSEDILEKMYNSYFEIDEGKTLFYAVNPEKLVISEDAPDLPEEIQEEYEELYHDSDLSYDEINEVLKENIDNSETKLYHLKSIAELMWLNRLDSDYLNSLIGSYSNHVEYFGEQDEYNYFDVFNFYNIKALSKAYEGDLKQADEYLLTIKNMDENEFRHNVLEYEITRAVVNDKKFESLMNEMHESEEKENEIEVLFGTVTYYYIKNLEL